MPQLLQYVLQNGALGQGLLPLQADARRGIFQETYDWLLIRGKVSPDWAQGQVLM